MNQVEFLGLAHAFATNNLATFKPFAFNPLKKGADTQIEMNKLYCCEGSAV